MYIRSKDALININNILSYEIIDDKILRLWIYPGESMIECRIDNLNKYTNKYYSNYTIFDLLERQGFLKINDTEAINLNMISAINLSENKLFITYKIIVKVVWKEHSIDKNMPNYYMTEIKNKSKISSKLDDFMIDSIYNQ